MDNHCLDKLKLGKKIMHFYPKLFAKSKNYYAHEDQILRSPMLHLGENEIFKLSCFSPTVTTIYQIQSNFALVLSECFAVPSIINSQRKLFEKCNIMYFAILTMNILWS